MIVHFFWTEKNPNESRWLYADYLAIKTALKVHAPECVMIWTLNAPKNNPWWEAAIGMEGVKVQSADPYMIPSSCVNNFSDYISLAVLYDYGGIFMDTDCISVRPWYGNLNDKSFMIGYEFAGRRLNIGVLAARKGSSAIASILDQSKIEAQKRFGAVVPLIHKMDYKEIQIVEPGVFNAFKWEDRHLAWQPGDVPDKLAVLHWFALKGRDEQVNQLQPGEYHDTLFHNCVQFVLPNEFQSTQDSI